MRLASTIAGAAAILILGLGLVTPACSGESQDPFAQVEPLLQPQILFQGVVREEDISLLFAHLRAALIASYQGRAAPTPEELNRRMGEISGELKARGVLAGLVLLSAFESAARQALSEAAASAAPPIR